MKNIIIIGAGGFGREVQWLIERINQKEQTWNILGYVDDGVEVGRVVNGIPVIGNLEYLCQTKEELYVTCAIGSTQVRKRVIEKLLQNKKLKFPNLIDPSILESEYVDYGKGNIVCAGNIFTVNISMGDFNIINLNCTLGHDDILESFITIYPGANISGNVKIGELSEIGTGTKVIQGKKIGKNSTIGAGAVVIKDVPDDCTAVGVPASVVKYKEEK